MEETKNRINKLVEAFGKEKRWVNWEVGTKRPLAINGYSASTTNPSTWSTYEEVLKSSDNVGIVFTSDQKLLGIDIDHCITNNELPKDVEAFVEEANTYTEISQSGEGLHLIISLTDSFKLTTNKHSPYEFYTSGRYFAVTQRLWKLEKEIRVMTPGEAVALLETIGYPWETKKLKSIQTPSSSITMDDITLIDKMFNSKNGSKIKSLYNGDVTLYDNDDSRADMAFCSHLAFWTSCNASQMERIWLASPLGNREKTQFRKDYRDKTIDSAIQGCSEVYNPYKEDFSDNVVIESLRESLVKKKREATKEISDYLINLYNIKTLGNRDNTKDIYLYDKGAYKVDYGLIKKEILKITEGIENTRIRDEILKTIKDKTWEEKDCFDVDKNLINLKNGIYNIKDKILIPHKPEYRFLHQIPVIYDKEIDCPKFKEFLYQILDDESVEVIQEWFGYCLYRSHFLKKAIVFLGERDTGKTTLIKVQTKFLGEKNISGASLQKLSADKFALSNLYQKHANIYDDLSFKDINDNGIFKMLTGGGIVTGEKKFGDQFQFNNFAKLTFSCNKIPNIKDTNDEAYFSRWIIIRFEHKPKTPNKFLFEEISTEEEMSGILNFALDGLYRLLEKQDFSYSKTPEEIKKEMTMSSSSLAQFVYNQLEVVSDSNVYITKEYMEQAFIDYAKKMDLPVISRETIGKNLPKYIQVVSARRSIENKETKKMEQVTCWIGVRFKNLIIQSIQKEIIQDS